MSDYPKDKVYVRRQPTSSRGKYLPLDRIMDLRWDRRTGGYRVLTSYPQIMGIISQEDAEGLDCSGRHDYSMFGIKVCLIHKYTAPEVWKRIINEVGECPYEREKLPACTKKILELLKDNSNQMTRKCIRDKLMEQGYSPNRIRAALKTMEKDGRIHLDGSSFSPKQIIRRSDEEK